MRPVASSTEVLEPPIDMDLFVNYIFLFRLPLPFDGHRNSWLRYTTSRLELELELTGDLLHRVKEWHRAFAIRNCLIFLWECKTVKIYDEFSQYIFFHLSCRIVSSDRLTQYEGIHGGK